MLATPMKAIAAKVMTLADVNIWVSMSSCAEKNVDKTPEAISRTIRYLRIEASTSKM
jgi:hypothetical protein